MPLKIHVLTKTVTTAGARERIVTQEINVIAVLIQAISTNAGDIYIGDNTVSSSKGLEIDPRDSVIINAKDLGWADELIAMREIWVDSDDDGDGVNILYLEFM